MALTAVEVYKHLPRKNCAECGVPTCLAFAMQLVQKKASLDKCPYISAEGKAALEGASAPPIRLVTIGAGPNKIDIGNETVLFRHEETFYHQPAIGIRVTDDLDDAALSQKIEAISKLQFIRVGMRIAVDLVAVENATGSPDAFKQTVEKVCQALPVALLLIASNKDSLAAALSICADRRPLIHAATAGNWQDLAALAKAHKCPLAVKAGSLEEAADLTQKIAVAGVEDMVLDVTGSGAAQTLESLTKARRAALRKNFRPLGFPTLAFTRSTDPYSEPAEASIYVAKYAAVVIMNCTAPWQALPVLTARQNIYTDPRKPIQVEAGLYAVGNATKDSPLLITTNFSLTYYTVQGEVEASRVPAHIGVIDTEGTSVLTAWASEKLTSEKVAQFLKGDKVMGSVGHKKVVIPGYVAVMSGQLEEDSGWKVLVGPREASGIPRFLKEYGSA